MRNHLVLFKKVRHFYKKVFFNPGLYQDDSSRGSQNSDDYIEAQEEIDSKVDENVREAIERLQLNNR